MSILSHLNDFYPHLVRRGQAAPVGFSNERISFVLVLSVTGEPLRLDDIRITPPKKKKSQPVFVGVPQAVKRSSGIKADFLWGNTAYVLGVTRIKTEAGDTAGQDEKTSQRHRAFLDLNLSFIASSSDPALQALTIFLQNWQAEDFIRLGFPISALDQNIVFALDQACDQDGNGHNQRRYLHQHSAAQELISQFCAGDPDNGQQGICLVTGQQGVIATLHPSIKGISGAQSSGAALISYNASAFRSFGKEQGANAPISLQVANACAAVLNTLLRPGSGQNVVIGDTKAVFWAENKALPEHAIQETESLFGYYLGANTLAEDQVQQQDTVRHALYALAQGKTVGSDQALHPETHVYILGLAPNIARLSVRYWHTNRLVDFARYFLQHETDMQVSYVKDKQVLKLELPKPWQILSETALAGKTKNVSPMLAGNLMRSILTGTLYPQTLLIGVLTRIRADGKLSARRAAICKACVNRYYRFKFKIKEDLGVSLDQQNKNPAYRLGRLFYLLENAQSQAIGAQTNATIRDRFFASASATPARVFPLLVRNGMNHLAKLRKDPARKRIAMAIERDVTDIFSQLEAQMPRNLNFMQQGEFVVGYFHQRHFRPDKVDSSPTQQDVS